MSDGLRAAMMIAADDGEAIWLQGGLCTIKAAGEQTGEQFSLAEQVMPRTMCTPIHIQPDEDEVFYVLDGTMTFYLDGDLYTVGAGAVVGVPRGAAHGFRVESETARFLVLNTPAGHERWFRAAGEPALSRELPSLAADDERVSRASREHGITIERPFPEVPRESEEREESDEPGKER